MDNVNKMKQDKIGSKRNIVYGDELQDFMLPSFPPHFSAMLIALLTSNISITMNRPGDSISAWETKKYIPKPGEPDLPPQLAELAERSTEETVALFNRMPFFMNKLNETDGKGGENVQLEALRSLAYEGTAEEIATNFKNQGNDCFNAKQFQHAVQYYTQGLEAGSDDSLLNVALYINRAACNLKLKNYRRCIEDCKRALQIDEFNVKACCRAGQAFLAIERLEEGRQILQYGLNIDTENQVILEALDLIKKKEQQVAKKKHLANEKLLMEATLRRALELRGIQNIYSLRPTSFLDGATLKLEVPLDVESQLIFPAIVLYPTIDEFDCVEGLSELTQPIELLETLLSRPQEWFGDPKHKNFNTKSLECYLETISGGLVKIGKKVAFRSALMSDTLKAPLFDGGLRLYVVPKESFNTWIKTWNKEDALSRRA